MSWKDLQHVLACSAETAGTAISWYEPTKQLQSMIIVPPPICRGQVWKIVVPVIAFFVSEEGSPYLPKQRKPNKHLKSMQCLGHKAADMSCFGAASNSQTGSLTDRVLSKPDRWGLFYPKSCSSRSTRSRSRSRSRRSSSSSSSSNSSSSSSSRSSSGW